MPIRESVRPKPQGLGPRTFRGRVRLALPAGVLMLLVVPVAASASRSERPLPPATEASKATPRPSADDPRASSSGDLGYVRGEVIVGYRPGAGRPARAGARGATRTTVEERLEIPRAELLEIAGNRSPERVARELESLPAVAYAQPNYYRRAAEIPDDPAFGTLWGIDNTGQLVRGEAGIAGADVSALDAWEITTGSDAVTVAVADTGVDSSHPDLAANIAAGGYDFVDDDADPADPNGHGTHVAGTIAAEAGNATGVAGVAPGVSLVPIRVLGANGIGTDEDIANGFDWAAGNGAQIVNASLSGEGEAPLIEAAIEAAPDTLFVVAAGNEGSDNDAVPNFPCSNTSPNLICVAATDQSDELAGFSNYGGESVDLAAPGVDVNSTMPAGVVREFFFDGFEESIGGVWAPGGDPAEWARIHSPRHSGGWSLADSPDGPYPAEANTWIDSPSFSLEGGSDCELSYWIDMQLDPGDSIVFEGSDDGIDWDYLNPIGWAGSATGFLTHNASQLDGEPAAQISFRLVAPGGEDPVGAGVHFDDVSVTCTAADPGYDFSSGTSMATPHVSAAAALLLSDQSEAGVADLRDAILNSVDEVPALAGSVATGGRLNAFRTLLPQTEITGGPEGPTSDPTPSFAFSSSTAAWLECRIAGGAPTPFQPCNPDEGFTPGDPLDDGSYTFAVRGANEHGQGPVAKRRFAIDTVAPTTRLLKHPKKRWRKRTARFRFTADEAPVTFECRLDKRPWRACTPPRRYRVKPGVHRFRARATDEAGNRGAPTPWRFRVLR